MKIVQLEYFCAVARLHSITQAAAELYVTQPAVSSAIKELEKERDEFHDSVEKLEKKQVELETRLKQKR